MSKNIAIVFAGGVGARMGSGLPKQFIEVNGKPIIIHTLDIFEEHPDIDEIYVACKEEYIRKLQSEKNRSGRRNRTGFHLQCITGSKREQYTGFNCTHP